MVQKKMILLASKNKDWIKICQSFGCNKRTAEDLVQEMYIRIQLKLERGLDIYYNDENEINYYYIFKTLRSMFLDLKKKNKNIRMEELINIDGGIVDIDYNYNYDIIKKELAKMYWYDQKVFEIINSGESIAEFSRKSGIAYHSLYNTYKIVKIKLKKLL
tara:strand:+ start:261 stop:740 length:480 start_codon:yes stop_codon:yes gene_type:complete